VLARRVADAKSHFSDIFSPRPPIPTGLALDYCVAYTCKDGAKAGFNVFCVTDASRGIAPESVAKEMDAMKALGVHVVSSVDDVPTHDIDAAMAAGGSRSEGGAGAAAVDLRALLLS